jgi:hypothetical protein
VTRTDALIEAITVELRARSAEIDGDAGLRSVGVMVKLSERTGKPSLVMYRPESHRALTTSECRAYTSK